MSEPTAYHEMYDKEPETIEDLIPNPWEEDEDDVQQQEVVEEVVEVEEVIEEPVDEEVNEEVLSKFEEVYDVEPKRVKVDIDPVAKLNLRATPSNTGDVIDKLLNGTVLKIVDSANDEWLFVEVEDAPHPLVGYVKKTYVIEV